MIEGFLILLWAFVSIGSFLVPVFYLGYILASTSHINKCHYGKYGSKTILVFLPFFHLYFLGKTYRDKAFGLKLLLISLFVYVFLFIVFNSLTVLFFIPFWIYQIVMCHRISVYKDKKEKDDDEIVANINTSNDIVPMEQQLGVSELPSQTPEGGILAPGIVQKPVAENPQPVSETQPNNNKNQNDNVSNDTNNTTQETNNVTIDSLIVNKLPSDKK